MGKQRWRIKKIKRAYATSDAEMIALVQAMAVEPASDRQFAAQPTLDQVLG